MRSGPTQRVSESNIVLNERTYPLSGLRGTPVSEQLYTMHITSGITGQERNNRGNCFRLSDTPQRTFSGEECDPLFGIITKCGSVSAVQHRYDYQLQLGSYAREVPKEKHLFGKIFTQRIERNNLTLRTCIKRLARRTICFSRSVELHEKVNGGIQLL